jgi:ubiquinone/menaquinone biosynthesis C-methylase UbiE
MRSPRYSAIGTALKSKPQTPLAAKVAYDLFADQYDGWSWQEFWHRNEWPHVNVLVTSAARNAVVLDVGSGTGFYIARLLRSKRTVFGVDISFGMLHAAQRRLGKNALLTQADATLLPFRPGIFDVVLLNRVASHLPELGPLLSEASRVLSSRGRLIVSDVAPEHDYSCTEFEAPESRVLVETHKHGIDDWRAVGLSNGMVITYRHVISAVNADWLPDSGFTSIDRTGKRPIGFVIALDRT